MNTTLIAPFTKNELDTMTSHARKHTIYGWMTFLSAFIIPISLISFSIQDFTIVFSGFAMAFICLTVGIVKIDNNTTKLTQLITYADKEQCNTILQYSKQNKDIYNFRTQLIKENRKLTLKEFKILSAYFNSTFTDQEENLYDLNNDNNTDKNIILEHIISNPIKITHNKKVQ